MYRHGDILLLPTTAPDEVNYIVQQSEPGERLVLATGEATGHAHVLDGLAAAVTVTPHRGRSLPRALVNLLEPGELLHEEHATIGVPPGWYEVVRQRVYTPAAPRWVED